MTAPKLCLIGPMGAGKSTLAKALAERWGLAAVDLDEVIAETAGRPIVSIFEESGEAAFRVLEHEVLLRLLADPHPLVLATGGGAPCQPGALEAMAEAGAVVWLDAPAELLARRALADESGPVRPLLAGLDLEGATVFLEGQLERRRPYYVRAHHRLDATRPIAELVDTLTALLPTFPRTSPPPFSARLEVALAPRPAHHYPIEITPDLPGEALAREARATLSPRARRLLVVTDTNVAPLYAADLEAALAGAGFTVARCVVPAGEPSKAMAELGRVLDACFDAGLSRDDALVALGGGVVGDLTGFAASIYQRGVAFLQVPTTLLAQVDSAVGGKTGVNHARGKNLIGAFWQPQAVISSQAVLATLPERELRCGLAEAVKHGFLAAPALVDAVLSDAPALRRAEPAATGRLVAECCRIKAEVVGEDEREDTGSGRRAILNLGHTFGHAFELLCGYGRLTHGEAVALGMVLAARLSERLGVATPGLEAEVVRVLAALGLPCDPDAPEWPRLPELVEAARGDKKGTREEVRFILLARFGEPVIRRLAWHEIERALSEERPDALAPLDGAAP